MWVEWYLPLHVEELMIPGQLLLQLHEALKGEMWVDGVFYYENGVKLEKDSQCVVHPPLANY